MACAIGKPEAYPGFAKHRLSCAFGYGVLIFTLYFVMRVAVPIAMFHIETGGIRGILNGSLPVFRVSKEGLWVEEPRVWVGNRMFLRADPGLYVNPADLEQMDRNFDFVLILDGEKILNRRNGKTTVTYYRELGERSLSSREAWDLIEPAWWFVILLILLLGYLGMGVQFLFGVLMLALAGKAIAWMRKAQIGFRQLYILTIYGRTFSLLLKGIVNLCGVRIPFFWVLNFGFTLLYVDGAIKRIRDDFTMKF